MLKQAFDMTGYGILYDLGEELDVKKKPYHFKFLFKRQYIVASGHIDRSFFHDHAISNAEELKTEYDRIMRSCKRAYQENRIEVPEGLAIYCLKNV